MYRQIALLTLLALATATARAESCAYTPPPQRMLTPVVGDSQGFLLPGPGKLAFSLIQQPKTFAHTAGLFIAQYSDGATLAHRELASHDFRARQDSSLPLPDFVRLVFNGEAEHASTLDREEADLLRNAWQLGCSEVARYRLGNIDVFAYTQTRQNGERYHALIIPDGAIVHYVDITSPDGFAAAMLASLHSRG